MISWIFRLSRREGCARWSVPEPEMRLGIGLGRGKEDVKIHIRLPVSLARVLL